MKKLLVLLLLALPALSIANYVFNYTDKTMSIKIYTSVGTLIATELILPYTSTVPQKVDMHNLTSKKMVVQYGKKKAECDAPSAKNFHDYEITINKDNNLTFTQKNTILGLPDGSKDTPGEKGSHPKGDKCHHDNYCASGECSKGKCK